MSGSLTFPMLGLILFCVLAETAREVCFKQSASQNALLSALARPVTWLGIFFWAVELLAWTAVLEHVALSIAFPLMALSYVVIVFAGALIFKENINLRHAAGVFLVTAGVACVGVTGL
ncbi:EamA family transporter [Rhizobium sp. BR 362]|uniref:EamA family transporter n=1 Tax=Rhizobium sp. BR 362 TaxID=3040670 RepID=UPI002F400AD5